MQPFHVLQGPRDDLGSLYTPAVLVFASGDYGDPEPDRVPFWPKPSQSLWLVRYHDVYERSFNLTMSSNSSALPD